MTFPKKKYLLYFIIIFLIKLYLRHISISQKINNNKIYALHVYKTPTLNIENTIVTQYHNNVLEILLTNIYVFIIFVTVKM